MVWWQLERIPEPEVMDAGNEVEAYASATAQAYLDRIDDTFVEHVLRLGVERGRVLDIGTGPGQIPLKIARRLPELELLGIDRSETMLAEARRAAAATGLAERVRFAPGDGKRLEFPDATFDLVLCNSVLHHFSDPVVALKEIRRVAKPGGAILVRDLQRPSRFAFPLHVRWYGRHYTGKMKELYIASVRSAYTLAELAQLVRAAGLLGLPARHRTLARPATPTLAGARLFRFGRTHIGLERPAS